MGNKNQHGKDEAEQGLVVSHFGVAVEVLFETGERRMVKVKRNSGHVVGDQVTVSGEVLTRLARRTELSRRDARGGIHLLAANLDVLGIVLAPGTPSGFLDRAIVAARAAGLAPFVVCNKCDLAEAEEQSRATGSVYGGILPIFPLSAATGAGMEPLRDYLRQGHRGAFVGTTGVGKSSLMNALCPELNLKVGALSDYNWTGRHTTTVSSLHALPGGGELVDTPGFRDFGLVDITAPELAAWFPGFEALRDHRCRFNDCRHRQEPGCAVRDEVGSGTISEERYLTYLVLLAEVEALEEAAQRRNWKK
ncbi:ribosome small subunit-dependent GTPase A [Geomonas subterranea]|uniref:Small ribosomal subunit biogenesis GTPase RsgA n=1 Tax=Geomonas subterranea TaxID=2847989 RepID=A0ABX8LMK9_9BACT|nr:MULTISPECIES: ribosome small subunit-dependent GTPase A [Geomonas]QXE92927.1 ribosome small subunit-dependent GTPase A [Geomonas subterranea]QXM08967.1 ribosome small subunit-dependent GTPase A [Geomonas subterranea]